MHLFETILSVSIQDIEFELKGIAHIDWSDFLLNPRRLRGSDFLMRWSQGVWAEKRLIDAVNRTKDFFAIPYGPSGTAPTGDVRAFELYFERLEQAGLGKIKRPDLLIFSKKHKQFIDKFIDNLGGTEELPFINEKNLKPIIEKAIIAVECENSLWAAQKMPDYDKPLKPQKRLGGKSGFPKNAVLPTVIIKNEDIIPLKSWQQKHKKEIHIWHVFFDLAFGISFNEIKSLLKEGLIEPTEQTFQAPGGATTKKIIYKIYYHYAYKLGISTELPALVSDYIQDKNGHILPYVKFEGGALDLTEDTSRSLKSVEK